MIIFDQQKIEISSKTSEIQRVSGFIDEICDYFNVADNFFGNILVAVTEAVQNSITHGNQLDASKKVTVTFEAKDGFLTFSIADEGYGFNHKEVSDPTDPMNDENVGRGLFLMECLTDDIIFNENGNEVTLKFAISSIHNSLANKRVEEFNKYMNGEKVEQKKFTEN